jgi:hypothetical protein
MVKLLVELIFDSEQHNQSFALKLRVSQSQLSISGLESLELIAN